MLFKQEKFDILYFLLTQKISLLPLQKAYVILKYIRNEST